MKKLILLLFLLCITNSVKAVYFYYGDELVSNMYMVRSSNYASESSKVYLVKRVDTKDFAYCIEPLTLLNRDSNYIGYEHNNNLFYISNDTLKKINIIAYYGYMYTTHEDNTWYGITQYLIWKTIYPDYDFYFADARFGNKVTTYDDKVLELESLVNRELAGFKINKLTSYKTGTYYTLINNSLLSEYEIVDSSDLDIQVKDNKLIVKSNKEGTYKIKLKHKNWRSNHYNLYDSLDAQDLFINGTLDDEIVITLKFNDVKLTVYKKDKDSILYTNLTTDGAIYNLYDSNNNLIATKTIQDSKMEFMIPVGIYYLEEVKAPYGYYKEENRYEIVVNDNMDYTVYDKNIYKRLIIHKQYLDDYLKDEENALFELYSNDILIDTYETNAVGEIELLLPYGTYLLKQIGGRDGYTFTDDIEIIVDDNLVSNIINIINKKEEPIIEIKDIKKEVLGANKILINYEAPDTLLNDYTYYSLFKILIVIIYVIKKIYL